jgi:hypothetical protein
MTGGTKVGTKIFSPARALLLLALLLAGGAQAPAFAKDKGEWKVKGELVGKKGEKTKDLSGIACAADQGFPRTCVIIDDELQAAQVVTLTDGAIAAKGKRLIPLIQDTLDGKPVELDGEGVAFAGGYFYVIGSHGRPRSDKPPAEIEAGLKASSKLVRFKLNTAGTQASDLSVSSKLAALIAQENLFDPYRDKELEKGGITIEGVAVVGDRLFAGFRGPTIEKHAVILSASLGYLFDDGPAEAKIVQIKLGHDRGVRDLAPYDNGILILAGPVSSESGTYSVLWWDGSSDNAKSLKDLPDYVSKEGKQWKPEGLLPIDRDKEGLRVLLLLDSAKNGKPRTERVSYP